MEKDKEKLRTRLSAYLDGELPAQEAERLASALQADEALRAELRALQATRDLLHKLPKEAAPSGLLDGIMEQLERKRLLSAPTEAAAKPARWPGYLAAAAVVALAIGLGIHLQAMWKAGWVDKHPPAGGPDIARNVPEPSRAAKPASPAAGELRSKIGEREDLERIGTADGIMAGKDGRMSKGGETADRLVSPAVPTLPGEGGVAERYKLWPEEAGRTAEMGRSNVSVVRRPSDDITGGRAPAYGKAAGFEGKHAGSERDMFVGQMSAGSHNLVLNTRDLQATNRKVYAVLNDNGIYGLDEATPAAGVHARGGEAVQVRGNTFAEVQSSPGTNEIMFYVDAVEVPKIIRQIKQIDGEVVSVVDPEDQPAKRWDADRTKELLGLAEKAPTHERPALPSAAGDLPLAARTTLAPNAPAMPAPAATAPPAPAAVAVPAPAASPAAMPSARPEAPDVAVNQPPSSPRPAAPPAIQEAYVAPGTGGGPATAPAASAKPAQSLVEEFPDSRRPSADGRLVDVVRRALGEGERTGGGATGTTGTQAKADSVRQAGGASDADVANAMSRPSSQSLGKAEQESDLWARLVWDFGVQGRNAQSLPAGSPAGGGVKLDEIANAVMQPARQMSQPPIGRPEDRKQIVQSPAAPPGRLARIVVIVNSLAPTGQAAQAVLAPPASRPAEAACQVEPAPPAAEKTPDQGK